MKPFKQYIEEQMKITPEMRDHYMNRTAMHINLVRKYCKKIDALNDSRFKGILDRAEKHDASKYNEPEKTPYIGISWYYKCKQDGIDYPYTDEMDKASNLHVTSNSHHPEYHSPTKVDLLNKERQGCRT